MSKKLPSKSKNIFSLFNPEFKYYYMLDSRLNNLIILILEIILLYAINLHYS